MNSPYQYMLPYQQGNMAYFPQGYQAGQPNIFAPAPQPQQGEGTEGLLTEP